MKLLAISSWLLAFRLGAERNESQDDLVGYAAPEAMRFELKAKS
jgi:hypothetical protein